MNEQDDQLNPLIEKTTPETVTSNPDPVMDPRLQTALEQQNKQRLNSDLLRSFQQLIAAGAPNSGFKPDYTMADTLEKRSNEPIEMYKSQVASEAAAKKQKQEAQDHAMKMKESSMRQEDFQMRLMKSKLDFQDMEANRDPNSPQSKIAQDRVLEIQTTLGKPVNEQQIRGMSGENLFKTFGYLQQDLVQHYKNINDQADRSQKQKEIDARLAMEKERNIREDKRQAMYDEDRDLNRQLRQDTAEENRRLKIQAKIDKEVENISKRFEKDAIPQREASITEIETYLEKQGAILNDPKTYNKVSIPGMGVGGGLRPDMLTPKEAVDFRQNVQSLANQLLKVRSGAAVTDPEYNRFLKEVGAGNFSTEVDLLSGLRKMKRDINLQKENILKSAEPEVRQEYLKRMGMPLDTPKGLSSKDKEALDWANSNPDDPRSAKIKQRLGM